MKLKNVPVDELEVTYFNKDDELEGDIVRKRSFIENDGSLNREAIIERYENQLSTIFDRPIEFHEDWFAVKRLVQLKGRKVYVDSGEFMNKLSWKINNVLDVQYINLRRINHDDEYAVIKLFTESWTQIRPYEQIFYLKYHGLSNIKNSEHFKKLSLNNLEDVKGFDSLGYPITEIFYLFCSIYVKYLKYNDDKFSKDKHSDLVNKTQLQIQNTFTHIISDPSVKESDIDVFVEKLAKLAKFGDVLSKIDSEVDVSKVFQASYTKGCRKIAKKICIDNSNRSFFTQLQLTIDTCRKLNVRLGVSVIPKFDVRQLAMFVQQETLCLANALCDVVSETYESQNVGDLRNVIKICYGSGELITLDWAYAADIVYGRELDKIEMPKEEKLRDMVRYFDCVGDVVKRTFVFDEVLYMRKQILGDVFMRVWNGYFKRDLPNHVIFYIDFKLKNMVKLKDRNKFEVELARVVIVMKFMMELMDRRDKVRFRKKYLSLYLQRMITSLYDDDFAIFINVCDCELELAKQLDKVYAAQSIFEGKFEKIHEEVIAAHELHERVVSKMSGLENNVIIGMKKIDDVEIIDEETQSVKLPGMITASLKEYAKLVKSELRGGKKAVRSDTKVHFEVSYGYSHAEVEFDGVLLCCNMYQCLILQCFNGDGDVSEDDILRDVGLGRKCFMKNMAGLCSEKHPVLVKSGNGWVSNNEFGSAVKFKKIVTIK